MPELRNPRWERFCQAYVELGNQAEAYRRAGYRKDRTAHDIAVGASRLMTFDGIKERITTLRAQNVFNQGMLREELAGYYVATIRTPAGEVHANHPLCQSVEVSERGTRVRMPDKNTAAANLARLNGWDAATKVEVAVVNPLTSYLRELRAKTVEAEVRDVPSLDNQGHTP